MRLSMKSIITALVVLAAWNTSEASAQHQPTNVKGPYANNSPYPLHRAYDHVTSWFHRGGQVLPVFQAAPWYLYWPYDAHFMTPAPLYNAPYMSPMGYGQPYMNPYGGYYGYGNAYGYGALR